MRWFIVAMAAACTPGDTQITHEDLESATFAGSFRSEQGCLDGGVELDVREVEPGWVEGAYHFVSDTGRSARYAVQGSLDEEGLMVLDQVEAEVDDTDEGTWCFGTLELGWDPLDGGLSGSWDAPDCGCLGSYALSDEIWR